MRIWRGGIRRTCIGSKHGTSTSFAIMALVSLATLALVSLTELGVAISSVHAACDIRKCMRNVTKPGFETLEIMYLNCTEPGCFPASLSSLLPTSIPSSSSFPRLTNDKRVIFRKVVCRDLQVQRCRTLSYTSRDIVVRTVAGTEPSTEVARFSNRHATQMCANTQHDEPFGLLDAIAVGLWVTESLPVVVLGLFDFIGSSVADEHGLATPLDDNVLAFRDCGEIDFHLGLREHVGGSGHVHQEVCCKAVPC